MFQVRVHGRIGQATSTAAELLAAAAAADGFEARAYAAPVGARPPGTPSVAYCQADRRPLPPPLPGRTYPSTQEADAVLILDPTLLYQVDVLSGLSPTGYALMNSEYTWTELGLADVVRRHGPGRALTVPATRLARAHLGRPLLIAPLLGGFSAQTGVVGPAALERAISERFVARMADTAVAAARAAYAVVRASVGAAVAEPTKPVTAAASRS